VRYEYAARGTHPAVSLTWYDGDKIPNEIHDVQIGDPKNHVSDGGNLFVGSKGMLLTNYDRYKLYPQDEFAKFEPPARLIPNSIGHHREC